MNCIRKYFPEITGTQIKQYEALGTLYQDWNSKINIISRKDIENIYERHILHSLGIAKMINFTENTQVMDVGTGGGFPGIPLAILFPDVQFHLIDSIGKKIKIVQSVAKEVELKNVTAKQCRIEEEKAKFDFIVSRAVTTLPKLTGLVKKNIRKEQQNALPNGLICLKGGDLKNEIAPFGKNIISAELKNYFDEDFFETKQVIYIPL